jgi:hypothetical protein
MCSRIGVTAFAAQCMKDVNRSYEQLLNALPILLLLFILFS